MNKARRHELKMLKYKSRLRKYRIRESEPLYQYHQDGGSDISVSPKRNLFAFRSHGKPCSCCACQQPENNYHRAKEREAVQQIISNSLIIEPNEVEIAEDIRHKQTFDWEYISEVVEPELWVKHVVGIKECQRLS